jgi:hypothetical protein
MEFTVLKGLQLKRTEIENEQQNEHQEKRSFCHGFMVQKGFHASSSENSFVHISICYGHLTPKRFVPWISSY